MDIRNLHRRAVDATGVVVDGLTDDQLGLPTPCARWTVRDVIDHMVDNNRSAVVRIGGGDVARQVPDPRKAYRTSSAEVVAAFAADGALERPYEMGAFGTFTGAVALAVYFSDVLVHGWDIGKAVGARVDLDEHLVTAAQRVIAGFPEQAWGPDAAFAEHRAVPPDAGAMERLLVTTGRDPSWCRPAA